MDSRIVLVTTGAVFTGGDQVPIDIRYSEPLSGEQYPQQRLTTLSDWQELDTSGILAPRYIVVWNYAGRDLQTYPDEETRQRIADSIAMIGFREPQPCLWIKPAKIGEPTLCGGIPLPLAPGIKVYAAAKNPNAPVPLRYMVVA